jgi:HK97 gp10 family phage protein
MMANEFDITGLADLQAQLDMLAPNIEKKLMRGALRAGQVVIANEAKHRVPVGPTSAENARLYGTKPGDLRDSIVVTTSARGGTVKATVKVGNFKAFYSHMIEYGTVAHLIKAAKGGALRFGGRDVALINHPGSHMQPFMRPALDMASVPNSAPFVRVGEYLAARITKELAKLPDETK